MGVLMIQGNFNGPPGHAGPPPSVGWVLVCLGLGLMLLVWTMGILIIYSGRCLKARRKWMFSVVIAGIMCLNMPLGTILGVFTLVVLLRDSVKHLYGIAVPPPYPYPAPPPY